MNGKSHRLYVAPMQGYTDAVWRHAHVEVYGDTAGYFTPFVRIEKGEPRARDMRDMVSPLNANHDPVPQIIFRDAAECGALLNALQACGVRRLDLNLGCPFPPQCRKGRGAAMAGNVSVMSEVAVMVRNMPEFEFSVKMRLGLTAADEWRALMPVLNDMPLSHITLHPRVASQQYTGVLHHDECAMFIEQSLHPVIFNGDIRSMSDIDDTLRRYPALGGVMAGRGLLRRPSLFAEWLDGGEWPVTKRNEHLLQMHAMIYGHNRDTLCGSGQILMKMRAFWEYMQPESARKLWKAIMKAGTLRGYETAVTSYFAAQDCP